MNATTKVRISPRRVQWNKLLRAAGIQSSEWLHAVIADPGFSQSRLSTLACMKVLRLRGGVAK
jgi:hypothetical protein